MTHAEGRPALSVLMPCLNSRPYIAAAVESILAQSFSDFELLLIDNGSTDGTYEYVQGLGDPRVRVLRCLERGLGRALNFGLAHCRAPLTARMDSDDISLPERFTLQLRWMEQHPGASAVSAQFRFLYQGRTGAAAPTPLEHGSLRKHLMAGLSALCHPALLFRTECARSFGGYRHSGYGEDHDFYLRLSEEGEIAALPEVLLLYRLHKTSVSFQSSAAVRLGIEYSVACARARQKQSKEPAFPEYLERRGPLQKARGWLAALSVRLYRESIFARIEGRPLRFASHLLAAAALNPAKTLLHLERLLLASRTPTGSASRPAAPDFVVVGAPKCGTTALYKTLQQHPAIFLPAIKEPNTFATELGTRRDVESFATYDRLFRRARAGQSRGECSVRYLGSPEAIPAILERRPDARIIALVRNPIDLFVSWHNQCLKSTDEEVADPEQAWRLQEQRSRGFAIPPRSQDPSALEYRRICSIGGQIARLIEAVPPGQRLVILYDDLAAAPEQTYSAILRFLGLPDDGGARLCRANGFSRPRSVVLAAVARACQVHPLLKRLRILTKPLLYRARIHVFERLFQGNFVPAERPRLAPAFHAELCVEFRHEVELLSRLLDRDLSHWLALTAPQQAAPQAEDAKKPARILGMQVSPTNYAEAARLICEWARQRASRYVCVASVNNVMEAYDSAAFQRVMNGAALVTPDGMPVVWGLRLLGHPQASRVYGPDLTPVVLGMAEHAGIPVGFYGASEAALAGLLNTVAARFPKLQVAYAYSPPFRPLEPEEDRSITGAINASGARILFVGLNTPKQDYWMAAHQDRVQAVMVGVGAAFDFLAGTKRQAPRWMMPLGLEWAFRLATEPGRLWKRYLKHNPRFVALFALELVRRRQARAQDRAGIKAGAHT